MPNEIVRLPWMGDSPTPCTHALCISLNLFCPFCALLSRTRYGNSPFAIYMFPNASSPFLKTDLKTCSMVKQMCLPYKTQPVGAGRHCEASLNTALGSERNTWTLDLGLLARCFNPSSTLFETSVTHTHFYQAWANILSLLSECLSASKVDKSHKTGLFTIIQNIYSTTVLPRTESYRQQLLIAMCRLLFTLVLWMEIPQ